MSIMPAGPEVGMSSERQEQTVNSIRLRTAVDALDELFDHRRTPITDSKYFEIGAPLLVEGQPPMFIEAHRLEIGGGGVFVRLSEAETLRGRYYASDVVSSAQLTFQVIARLGEETDLTDSEDDLRLIENGIEALIKFYSDEADEAAENEDISDTFELTRVA